MNFATSPGSSREASLRHAEMTREMALEALSLGALEIACEPLFERFLNENDHGRRLATLIEHDGDQDAMAMAVFAVWEQVVLDACAPQEWFHNNRTGQAIVKALQVLEGVESRHELYAQLRRKYSA